MSYFSDTTPEFPVISWLYNIPDAFVVSVIYNAATFVSTFSAGNYWGFANDSSNVADADSLMGALATAVQEAMTNPAKHNVPAAVIEGGYEWSTGDTIALRGSLTASGFVMATDIRVVVSQTSMQPVFGSDGTSPDFDIIAGVGYGDFNVAGFWAPYQKTVYDERGYRDTTYGSEGIDSNSTSVVRWGSQKINRLLEFPDVYAAYVYEYRRVLAVFSTPARTDPTDPNNLLQNLRDAAIDTGSNFTYRIYQDDGEYREGRIIESDRLQSLESFVDDVSARGARFKVSIPFRDLGTSVGGAI